jgi:hypothetical protein
MDYIGSTEEVSNSFKRWARVRESAEAYAERIMAGECIDVSFQKKVFRVYRKDKEYLVIAGGTVIKNPHPQVLRKGKESMDCRMVAEIMES